MAFLRLQRRRHRGKEKNAKKKKVVISRYVPFEITPFVRKVVLFRPNPHPAPTKHSKWFLPPVTRPRSRPWSAMIKRLRRARVNQVSPIKPIRPKLHGKQAVEQVVVFHSRQNMKTRYLTFFVTIFKEDFAFRTIF